MLMAGLKIGEIAKRLNVEDARELVEDGTTLAHLYSPETLPTTLTAAERDDLAALEAEHFPTQRQWNAVPPPSG
jgi:hypothetical protein